jgi:hypothetical protein
MKLKFLQTVALVAEYPLDPNRNSYFHFDVNAGDAVDLPDEQGYSLVASLIAARRNNPVNRVLRGRE